MNDMVRVKVLRNVQVGLFGPQAPPFARPGYNPTFQNEVHLAVAGDVIYLPSDEAARLTATHFVERF